MKQRSKIKHGLSTVKAINEGWASAAGGLLSEEQLRRGVLEG